MKDIQCFDPKQPYSVANKTLPHWAQAGTACFITWRTADSLPAAAHRRLTRERAAALQAAGLEPRGNWKHAFGHLPDADRRRVQWRLFSALDGELDRGFGECLLARPELSQIVADALLHFDGDRYVLTDFVVMPNHVHLLAAFRDEDSLLAQCTAWKRYTAGRINKALGRQGEFWQREQFDHLVRRLEKLEQLQRYIAENPRQARLAMGMYRHYSAAAVRAAAD